MTAKKIKASLLQKELDETRNRICQILDVLHEEFLITKEEHQELKELVR